MLSPIEARKIEASRGKSKIRTAGGGSVSSCHSYHFLLLSWTAAALHSEDNKLPVNTAAYPRSKIHHQHSENVTPHRSQIVS
jgi:hypothetical protein